jgi:hypothetical protein
MRFIGFFFFLSLKRSIYKTISNFVQEKGISNELPTEKNHLNSNSKNITELLLPLSVNITRKHIEGEDNRISEQEQEQENSIRTIEQNMAKKQLLTFLEDPAVSDIQKIERIRESEHMFINADVKENGTYLSSIFPGITKGKLTMGMGGFDDCYDFIDLVL